MKEGRRKGWDREGDEGEKRGREEGWETKQITQVEWLFAFTCYYPFIGVIDLSSPRYSRVELVKIKRLSLVEDDRGLGDFPVTPRE